MEYGPAPLMLSGGFGSGKTYSLSRKAMLISDMFPKNRGVILRRVFEELTKTTMKTFFKLCPPSAYNRGGHRADSQKYLRLNNGSEILWIHTQAEDAIGVLKGIEINWFLMDQAEEIDEEVHNILMGRLGRWEQTEVPEAVIQREVRAGREWRWWYPDGRPAPPTYAMSACNPDTEFHWIYRKYHPESEEHHEDRGDAPSYASRGYKMITMDSMNNKFLSQQNKDELSIQSDTFKRRYVRGLWGIPEGLMHEVDPLSIIDGTPDLVEYLKNTCTLHRTLDHGDSAPTCCSWWAVDKSGNIFLFMEYYQPNRIISDHRREISSLSRGMDFAFNLADPAIFTKMPQKSGGRWSVADEYLDAEIDGPETIIAWEPADNNELMTRSRINEYLAVDPNRIHPTLKTKGSPRLFFIKKTEAWPLGANYTLRQLRAQRRIQVGTDLGKPVFSDERDDKIPDHGYDTIRYFVASRPPVADFLINRVKVHTFNHIRHNVVKFRKAGGYRALAEAARRRNG